MSGPDKTTDWVEVIRGFYCEWMKNNTAWGGVCGETIELFWI